MRTVRVSAIGPNRASIKKGAANGTFSYDNQLLLKLRSGDADRP